MKTEKVGKIIEWANGKKNHKKGGKIEKTRGIEGRKNEKGKKKKGN